MDRLEKKLVEEAVATERERCVGYLLDRAQWKEIEYSDFSSARSLRGAARAIASEEHLRGEPRMPGKVFLAKPSHRTLQEAEAQETDVVDS